MDDSDILNFGHTRKISFKEALRDVKASRPNFTVSSPPESSSISSDFSDEDEGRYGRNRKLGGRAGSLASRLMHNRLEPAVISSDSEDEDSFLLPGEKKKVKKRAVSPESSESPSFSPSPEPSPPMTSSSFSDTPTDRKSKRVLNKASNALNQLICSTYSTPGSEYSSDLNESLIGSASKERITIRVRYRGNIRKYTISKGDPLSVVCSLLASELKADSSKFLLSHKTSTLSLTDSPLSLGLTTADIIDAIQMSESLHSACSEAGGPRNLRSGGSNIKIKIQTSKRSINYSIARTDPLKKAMEAFAKEMHVLAKQMSFSFDGDPIAPTQTAEDFDMEDGDCIDARILH